MLNDRQSECNRGKGLGVHPISVAAMDTCRPCRDLSDEWDGQTYELSRRWVIYRDLEHDLHHGSEVSLILGMNGLQPLHL